MPEYRGDLKILPEAQVIYRKIIRTNPSITLRVIVCSLFIQSAEVEIVRTGTKVCTV